MAKKSVLFVNDLHTGQKSGICPARWDSYRANSVQKRLERAWNWMADHERPDYLVMVGDMVEGPNRKELGRGCWTTDVNEQVDVAVELVKRVHYKKAFAVEGSGYHTGMNPSGDEMVARRLGAEFYDAFVLRVLSKRVHVRHQTGFSSVDSYRMTPLARDLVKAAIIEKETGHMDAIVRAHVHYLIYGGSSSAFGITLPCWKGVDGFMLKRNMDVPTNGYVVIEVDGDEISWRHNTFTMERKMHTPEAE